MIREIIGYGLIYIGIAFDFFGVLGLVRLPDVYNRLQAATKSVTFGTGGILLGIFILQGLCKIIKSQKIGYISSISKCNTSG